MCKTVHEWSESWGCNGTEIWGLWALLLLGQEPRVCVAVRATCTKSRLSLPYQLDTGIVLNDEHLQKWNASQRFVFHWVPLDFWKKPSVEKQINWLFPFCDFTRSNWLVLRVWMDFSGSSSILVNVEEWIPAPHTNCPSLSLTNAFKIWTHHMPLPQLPNFSFLTSRKQMRQKMVRRTSACACIWAKNR